MKSPILVLLGMAIGACSSSDEPAKTTADASVDAEAATPSKYLSVFMIERWARTDPKAEHTMTGVITVHTDDTMPRVVTIDEHCRLHEGIWSGKQPGFGPIRMQGTDIGEVEWTQDELGGAGYEHSTGIPVWNTGSKLKLVVGSATFPGFELEDTVPAQAVLTSHDFVAMKANELQLRRDGTLDLAWTPVSTEVFTLVLQFVVATGGNTLAKRGLWCFYPGAQGKATIPNGALSRLEPTSTGLLTNLYFGGASRKRLALDRVDVEMVTWKGQAVRATVP